MKVIVFDVMPVLFIFLEMRSMGWNWNSEIGWKNYWNFMGCGLEMWWHHPCRQPRHGPWRQTRHCPWRQQHVIKPGLHIATIRDVYFHHRKRVWVGLWGPGDILRRFQNVMDQAIHDEILRNVTRCDLWRSIHDVIWDRHRYCFMTGF